MKTSYLIILLGIICPIGVFAQKMKTIELDFKNKEFANLDTLENLKEGELYQLKIKDINMNLYKVVIDKEDTVITSNVTFPTFDMMGLDGISGALGKLDKIVFSQLSPDKAHGVRNGESMEELIKANKTQLEVKLQKIRKYKSEMDDFTLLIQKNLLRYSVNDTSRNDHYSWLKTNLNFKEIIIKTDEIRAAIKNISEEIAKQASDYNESIKDLTHTQEEGKNHQLLLEAFAAASASADKLYERINAEKVISWLTSIIYKENNAERTYTSLPMQFTGDKSKLTITIKPQKEEYGLPEYSTELNFPIRKRFYAGIGMSFYCAGFKDERYGISATGIDSANTNYRIVDEENKKGEIGLTTLLHLGYRPFDKADWISGNIVIGPALSFTGNIRPRAALGGGISFGRKQMLSINVMAMSGYVDRRSKVYEMNQDYISKPEQITMSRLKTEVGFSVGYIYKF